VRSRKTLAIMLNARGFDVSEAQSGEELLKCVIEDNPDVILLDVMMPGMSGVEACIRIKENPKTAAIPVILITAVAGREERLKGLAAGARDFIAKPVEADELVLRVGNAVLSGCGRLLTTCRN
jgi:DNA-binding response OmpR family regulator